ncbi:aspartate/glutamate racemase family protein [Pollutimonas harenae]|uniref:Aspartate/glutamate racemase family protein n=1 Tax=Pollutimonas harenae TaxID=657015 RepID=A0A853GVB7_9BURK|nr:aspartate/glutamate racemase family protein [Pollutimonas harenae]NYT84726.1 aspartate/glutamate racemase family protein [Pollutimonas harenae]TEA72872.1 aspartate/glutamate racemase family protein [Pollutimonas harenae]
MPDSEFAGRFLGVLGGMGPMASAVFMVRLTALTDAASDQHHVPAMLWSDPRIPDRPAGHAGTGADPFPWMLNGVRHIERAGAGVIAIPCNTAHLWYDKLAASTSLPVLHIVRSVVADLRRHGIMGGRIGLLGTVPTLNSGLYQHELEAQGYQCVLLPQSDLLRYCAEAIRLVKVNQVDAAQEPAVHSVQLLRQQGVDAVVLGCTELPLAVPAQIRPSMGVAVIDSIDALALAALDWYRDA